MNQQNSVSRAAPLLALALVGAASGCKGAPSGEAGAPASGIRIEGDRIELAKDAPQWRYVEVAPAKLEEPLASLPAPGRVAVDELRTSSMGAPVAGRVEQVLVRVGERVRSGQRLFSIRSANLGDVQHEIEAAKADAESKRAVEKRTRELVEMQAAPARELVDAAAELRQAELALKAAESRASTLRSGKVDGNLYWVEAQHEGTIVDGDVAKDQQVGPDRPEPLLRIADLRSVIVFASVQERDVGDIAVGAFAQVKGHDGTTSAEGRVEGISDVFDPQRRTIEVRVRVPNADRKLRPNAFVDVTFPPAAKARRIRVPSEAVVTDGEVSAVFVSSGAGRFDRHPVRVGRERGGQAELVSGLEDGQLFVARGALLLLNAIDLTR